MQPILGMELNRRILLRSLRALIHRVVASDFEDLAICRRVLHGRRLLGQDKKFSFLVDALKELAGDRWGRLGVVIGDPNAACRRGCAQRIDGGPDPQAIILEVLFSPGTLNRTMLGVFAPPDERLLIGPPLVREYDVGPVNAGIAAIGRCGDIAAT